MASNAIRCADERTDGINYNGLPLTIGSFCSVDFSGGGKQPFICFEVTNVDQPISTNLAISAYTDCYECLSNNQGFILLYDCFREGRFVVTIDGLGFVPTGDTIYLTIEDYYGGNTYTSCFNVGEINQLTPQDYTQGLIDKEILVPQSPAIAETSCNTCLQNNLFTYEVQECLGGGVIYVNLPFGLNDSLISYTDGINQFCGTVGVISTQTPGPYTYISNFGNTAKCNDCLDVVNDKILIQSCTDSEIQEVVWASALFQNGDVSNLSNEDGCFEVIGLTEDPVTIDTFLNFDPQPGCEPCIECNGINYEYVTCDTISGFDNVNLYPVELGDTPLGISCTEYSSGSNKIYVGTNGNSSIYVFDPLTNTVVSTTIGMVSSYTGDIEYFNPTTVYTLSTEYLGPTGSINKIDTTTDTLTSVFSTASYNYYMSTDATNNRLFYTSYNTSSGYYQVNSFNTLTNTITDTFSSSSGYYRIKYAPNSNKVYTLSGYYNVKVLNADDLSVASTLTFSSYLNDIEYNPCTEQIYITTNNLEIYVIDTVSDTVVNTISTPYDTNLIKYNPSDSKMYITTGSIPNPGIMVFNPATNNIDFSQGLSTGGNIVYSDFTFYPTDNEIYLPYTVTGGESGNGDYLGEAPMTFNTNSGYFKSYQYLPNNSYFYNQYLGTCCQIVGTSSNYYETLFSVQTFDDCSSCQTCHGQVWEAYGCGLSTGTTFNVLVDGGLHQGDIVKLMWGQNGWICAELNQPISTFSNYYENYFVAETDSYGSTQLYNNCSSCQTFSQIGLTIVNCDTGVERFVSISVEDYMQLNSLEKGGLTNYVISDPSGCYQVSNFCPIPLSATTGFDAVQFYVYCSLCSPADPSRSANTETFICITDCAFTGSTAVSPPHPVWTDGYGNAVTQLNMVVLGGPNGLNG